MDRPRLCFDRTLPTHLLIPAAHHAASENPRNIPAAHPWADGLYPAHPAIALQIGKTWEPGRTLLVYFFGDVSRTLRANLFGVWQEWSRYASITFAESTTEAGSDIKVTTRADPGSWSYIGTDCHMVPAGQPTMNYGWLDDSTDAVEVRRVGLHEMGHGLGCIHEHQNPTGGLVWNVAKVLSDYEGPPNYWSADDIQQQVIQKYSSTQLLSTSFDRTSIMEYPIAAGEATDAAGNPVTAGWNTDLSPEDMMYINMIYPMAAQPNPAPPPQPPAPPPEPAYPILVPGGGPYVGPLLRGQVARFDLRIPATAFYVVQATGLATSFALTVSNLATDPLQKTYGHGHGMFLGRLKEGDYLLSIAPTQLLFSGNIGVACRPLGGSLGLL